MRLRTPTRPEFTERVLADLNAFLVDHAANERKASALAMSLVMHYPDRRELVRAMIDVAQEELEHFAQVAAILDARGVIMGPDQKDPYVGELLKLRRKGREHYFLDRLLLAGIIEARGCERFAMIGEALEDEALAAFYRELARAEARHHALFIRLARVYFDPADVRARLDELLDAEAAIVDRLPLRARLH